jgi:hypothetical protein
MLFLCIKKIAVKRNELKKKSQARNESPARSMNILMFASQLDSRKNTSPSF